MDLPLVLSYPLYIFSLSHSIANPYAVRLCARRRGESYRFSSLSCLSLSNPFLLKFTLFDLSVRSDMPGRHFTKRGTEHEKLVILS